VKKLLPLLLLLAGAAHAQSVQQSGSVTPNHVPVWTTNGVIQDGGTASSGLATSFGVTNNGGPGICVNSAPITGPYNALCLSASTSGAGLAGHSISGKGKGKDGIGRKRVILVGGTAYPWLSLDAVPVSLNASRRLLEDASRVRPLHSSIATTSPTSRPPYLSRGSWWGRTGADPYLPAPPWPAACPRAPANAASRAPSSAP
jgi:hypothetical protein